MNRDSLLRIRVLTERNLYFGGTVDVEITSRTGRHRLRRRGVDASREIRVRGLRRRAAPYTVTIRPPSGLAPQTRNVDVSASGDVSVEFSFPSVFVTHQPGLGSGAFAESDGAYVVSGRVSSPGSASVGGLLVVVVDRNVGKDITLAESITDERGQYLVRFTSPSDAKAQFDLQARVLSDGAVVGASEVKYNAAASETLNIVLPAGSVVLASEHETLVRSLSSQFSGPLRNLRETDERPDISYLANKTGWDARAVALAALADQFGQIDGQNRAVPAIEAPFYYALFRAGLPANPDTLYRVDSGTVNRVWREAIDAGVISGDLKGKLAESTRAFEGIAADKLLTVAAPAAVSPLQDLLSVSRLNPSDQAQFAALYAAHRTDLSALWNSVTKTFGDAVSNRLQVNGKIALLTLNNAPLMQALQSVGGEQGLTDPAQLALAGFYTPAKWSTLLSGDTPVPERIPGGTSDLRRSNYAAYLAAQVRLSYPTAAVAHMVEAGDLKVEASDRVRAFLVENSGKFEIGVHPVESYIAVNKLDVPPAAVREIKRIQRLYQMSPSDRAMSALLARGIDSAYQVVRYDSAAFVRDFAADLGGEEEALQVYHKSTQIHNTLLNVVVSYLTARNGLALGVEPEPPPASGPGLRLSRPGSRRGRFLNPTPRGADATGVLAYPTLEGLFGSMDFCACEECRSILSPSAYLVDLLNFADQPSPPAGTRNPQEVLLERRPDLQHLPLTCENTNTALPYIDVVNETLEYFLSNDVSPLSLSGYLGHDTGDAASADLLASPQYVLNSAYQTLEKQFFPSPLPFHKSLEELRLYFDKFEVPLPYAMERFRVGDNLEHGTHPYGWRDILMEEARLSRPEHRLLTDGASLPFWRIYGLPNGTSDADAIAALSNAREFARRMGMSYVDLVAILKSRFVNPDIDLIPKIERLGVSFGVIAALKDGTLSPAEFEALLPSGAAALDPDEYGGDIQAWITDDQNFARIMGLIVLVDPTGSADPCDFDSLELRHSQPLSGPTDTSTRLTVAEFSRILRLIRLWNKTQWTIEQTDQAICALFNADLAPGLDVDTIEKLDAGFLIFLPRLGILLRVMRALNLSVSRDLLSLLAVWSPIGTQGPNALYRQMFLNPAILEQDGVFADNGFGKFLQGLPASETVTLHAAALRSAFNLTGDEFDQIFAALEFDANTPLNLANISAVFRHGWLARKLSLSIREFLLLVDLTGLDPFAPPNPTRPAILELADLVQDLKDRGLRSAAAFYLVWNQDLSGTAAPDPAQVRELARTLRADFAAVDLEFAVTDDPTGDIARARMALIYGPEATNTFFGFIDDTVQIDVPYTNPQPHLKPSITAADPRISYDRFRHLLSCVGVFTAHRRNVLRALTAVPAAFKTAVDDLFDHTQDVMGSFFARYPELRALYDAYVASPAPPEKKRRELLAGFRPELSRIRKQQQALQRVSAAVSIDLPFTQGLLSPPATPYALHAAGHSHRPALADIVGMETQGLAVQFFFRNTATGNVDKEDPAAAILDYSPHGDNPLPENPDAGKAISGVWRGLVEAPEAGFHNFVIEADTTARVTLHLAGVARDLTQNGRIWRNSDPIELAAGTLYPVRITVERVRDKLAIRWEAPDRPREVIPSRVLYPLEVLDRFSDMYTRFAKIASLAVNLKLTVNEIAFLGTSAGSAIGGDHWLNVLPVRGKAGGATAAALLRPFTLLLDFARIKAAISPDDESLLEILEDPAAATATPESALYSLTRWDPASLEDIVAHFKGTIAELKHPSFFIRVYDAFELVRTMGIAGGALIAAATNDPDADTVRDLQGALRARYEPDDWPDVVQPINDTLRGLRRDALVAYIVHRLRSRPATAHIDTPDKLFEYFLMDVQMEPCMQTSRVRHALSSAQLFIERCLMNLEPEVSPESLNPRQWEWMKRYRVWEANRKVFLFPENWAEPELRDDKSPFFKELEAELLQGEITEDSATVAILNYLSKLESVAKLHPVGIHHIPANPGLRTGEIDHVLACTPGSRRKYFYRRREYGYWTAWEQVKLDIEDNPVLPVVWDDRVLLFWLQVMKKTPDQPAKPGGASQDLVTLKTSDIPGAPAVTTQAVLSWSEYYNGKWQAPKSSDVDLPADIVPYAIARRHLTLSVSEKNDWLRVGIEYGGSNRTSFILHNTHSSPVRLEDQTSEESATDAASGYVRYIAPSETYSSSYLYAYYYSLNPGGGSSGASTTTYQFILSPDAPVEVVTPHHPLNGGVFEAPFFVDDRRNVFFVRPTHELRWISDILDIGVSYDPGYRVNIELPPLVAQVTEVEPKPSFWGDGGPVDPDPGTIYQVGIQQFVSEDAYIRQGIGTAAPVQYDGKQIGPSGAMAAPFQAGGFARARAAKKGGIEQ